MVSTIGNSQFQQQYRMAISNAQVNCESCHILINGFSAKLKTQNLTRLSIFMRKYFKKILLTI